MTAKNDPIAAAMDRLQHISSVDPGEQEHEWAGQMDQALAALEQAIRERSAPLRPADGRLIDVDRPRIPSPTVARRTRKLRRELYEIITDVTTLRNRLHGEAGTVEVRRSIDELLEYLQEYIDHEAKLVLQTVNTDIGAGD